LLRRFASSLLFIMVLPGPAAEARSALASPPQDQERQSVASSALATMNAYAGLTVESIDLPGVPLRDRQQLLQLLPQKEDQPLNREQIRESIHTLFGTGRFSDIEAEAAPSGSGVKLSFVTSPNYFVGAVDVEGAPNHPSADQIANASKFQLGEHYTLDKLDRALRNIRQVMQENGYYRAQVTAETTSYPATQQVNILFHVKPGGPAHVGEVKVTGTSSLSSAQLQNLAKMHAGDVITAARITNSLQRLRKRFQKQRRVLAQVSIADQVYEPVANSVDYTFEIEPGPVVLIRTQGFRIKNSLLKKEIPVYEENAADEDLLNEGKRNLLDYLQTRGYFDAKVDIQRESTPQTLRIVYQIDPGPVHKLVLIRISGNKYFPTSMLRARLQMQPAGRFLSHGRYSEALLKSDVSNLQALYVSNGFRGAQIESKVDDNYHGSENQLAVFLDVKEGPQTLVGKFLIEGNKKAPTSSFPELDTQEGQPYSEQNLANDRDKILNYYFNHGFPNATLEIATAPSSTQRGREDVTYDIQEGEQFFVDQVMIGGLDHTRKYVVQREIQTQSGQPLSQQDLLDTQTKLYDLGIFSQVDTAVQNPGGSDPQKNVLVQVQEAKRYTFTYGVGLEFQTGQPAGTTAPAGATGVSPRVGFNVTRLNVGGRDQTLIFQSHVGRLQQRGLISYEMPKLFNNDRLKLTYTVFYDNSLDVSTFTSQRLEGRIDLRQQLGRQLPNRSSSLTYRFEYRRVKASNFITDFSPGLFPLLSSPARVGGPGFTYIRDKRDNPLESTKGSYLTVDGFAASGYFGSQADFARLVVQNSTYYPFGHWNHHPFVFARSTTVGLEQVYRGTRVLPPGSCPINPHTGEPTCSTLTPIPFPELLFAGGGNSIRGFGLNQAGPRDPDSGGPVGGTALFVNNLELRLPTFSLPYLGQGFGIAIFEDMGNVFTAGHDLLKGMLRWHQPDPAQCLVPPNGTPISECMKAFNDGGYDYTSHAVGVGLRYKTPIGPLRFDFGYNLNPTRYFVETVNSSVTPPVPTGDFVTQRLRRFNVFFSIGQPF